MSDMADSQFDRKILDDNRRALVLAGRWTEESLHKIPAEVTDLPTQLMGREVEEILSLCCLASSEPYMLSSITDEMAAHPGFQDRVQKLRLVVNSIRGLPGEMHLAAIHVEHLLDIHDGMERLDARHLSPEMSRRLSAANLEKVLEELFRLSHQSLQSGPAEFGPGRYLDQNADTEGSTFESLRGCSFASLGERLRRLDEHFSGRGVLCREGMDSGFILKTVREMDMLFSLRATRLFQRLGECRPIVILRRRDERISSCRAHLRYLLAVRPGSPEFAKMIHPYILPQRELIAEVFPKIDRLVELGVWLQAAPRMGEEVKNTILQPAVLRPVDGSQCRQDHEIRGGRRWSFALHERAGEQISEMSDLLAEAEVVLNDIERPALARHMLSQWLSENISGIAGACAAYQSAVWELSSGKDSIYVDGKIFSPGSWQLPQVEALRGGESLRREAGQELLSRALGGEIDLLRVVRAESALRLPPGMLQQQFRLVTGPCNALLATLASWQGRVPELYEITEARSQARAVPRDSLPTEALRLFLDAAIAMMKEKVPPATQSNLARTLFAQHLVEQHREGFDESYPAAVEEPLLRALVYRIQSEGIPRSFDCEPFMNRLFGEDPALGEAAGSYAMHQKLLMLASLKRVVNNREESLKKEWGADIWSAGIPARP